MKTDYLELVRLIIKDQLTLGQFNVLYGVDFDAVEEELQHLLPVAYTATSNPKPIYFFKSADFPNLGKLFHCSKLFTFAHGGSPYKDPEISEYDLRENFPYIQAGVYDPTKKLFSSGLRFLPSCKEIPFEMSAIKDLFVPAEEFTKTFLPSLLEVGQTFVTPDAGVIGGQYLFSIMASLLALFPNAKYLFGKPTIEGRVSDISKEIISAYALDAFDSITNKEFNPDGKQLLTVASGVFVPKIRSLEVIVQDYNSEINDKSDLLTYSKSISLRNKRKITEKLLLYYGGCLPPMFKFYSILTEEGGMICLSQSVLNPVYTTQAWEFPILMNRTKIVSVHKKLLEYYIEYFKDKDVFI